MDDFQVKMTATTMGKYFWNDDIRESRIVLRSSYAPADPWTRAKQMKERGLRSLNVAHIEREATT